jgi:hypothetical protein
MTMRNQRNPRVRLAGVALVLIGVALVVLSVLADYIGIGAGPMAFGYRQFIGLLAGLSMLVVGLALVLTGNGMGQP